MRNDPKTFDKELNELLKDAGIQKLAAIPQHNGGITHPKTALEKASDAFDLTDKERNIIRSHMWPLTLFHPPKSREAWLVSMADKYCAFKEMFFSKKG